MTIKEFYKSVFSYRTAHFILMIFYHFCRFLAGAISFVIAAGMAGLKRRP